MNNNQSTIMITDIVGYSKLSGDNQDVALELLKEHDKILFNSLSKFKGNILKNRGDGVIAQFDVCSNAIKCSVEIQRKLKRRNTLNIKDRQLNIRIGIHYGEYIKEGNEIYGDCISIATKLEPLAPSGGIVISEQLSNQVKSLEYIYIREYKKIQLDTDKNQEIYEIYIDIFDWYKNKKNKKSITFKTDFLSHAHSLLHKGDFSGAIKYTILYKESLDCKDSLEVDSFLANLFISIGYFEEAKRILNNIEDKYLDVSMDFKGHILKLRGHLFFNEQKWNKSQEYYNNALEIFISKKSKYINEVYFYKGMIDIINELNSPSFKNKTNKSMFYKDDFLELMLLQNIIYQKNKKNNDFSKIKILENNRSKAYWFWLQSKVAIQLEKFDDAYKFETKAQEFIKLSSKDISDFNLRNFYLDKIFLHKMIITQTFISIDSLFLDDDLNDEFNEIDNFSSFDFCVNCGLENIEEKEKCIECDTILIKEYYEKN